MSQTYRALLVGTGSVAESHVRAVEHTFGRVALAGAVDIDAERLKAFCTRHKLAAAHADYAAALRATRPDLVLVAAPPALHADMTIKERALQRTTPICVRSRQPRSIQRCGHSMDGLRRYVGLHGTDRGIDAAGASRRRRGLAGAQCVVFAVGFRGLCP